MPFYRYFAKNNAQGIILNDSSSQITFQAGHTLPIDMSSGEFLLTLGGPGGEIVKVTDASQDGSGILTVDVTRALEDSSYLDATSGTIGYLYLTAGMFNNAFDILEQNDIKLLKMDITGSVDLDQIEADTVTNNAKVSNVTHTGDVTGADVLGIVPDAISGKTGVTPVAGDYLLLWDATDSALKKVDVTNFLNLVTSVNGLSGVVNLVTNDISDTISTQKYTTAADITKMSYISVTQAVDLDTMESNITTNNAKITNANHTGDVTGADVLGIVPAAISGKTGVTPVSGDYMLLWDATDSLLKKVDASNFLNGGVSSVNGFTGAVTLVTGNISDTTSTQKYTTAANLTKIGFIDVTSSINLNTLSAAVTLNTAKVTNANHTGDVTGSDVLGIVPAAISGRSAVTAVAGDYVLLWDATDSALKKVDVSSFINGSYGDVTGPASSTNTGIAIYNGTGGKTLMNSLVTIDTSSLTIPGFLTVTGQARHANQTALSTSAIVTWNINNDPKANIILTNDVTSFTISGININSEAVLYLKQDATVAKTITWPGTISWAGGSQPNLSTLNSKHVIAFYSYDGTGLIGSHISDDSISTVSSVNGLSGTVTLVTGNISDTTSTQKYVTSADVTKLGYISVTQAVNLDTIESDTTTNNAKVTNADHTGDVTGSAGLVIVPAAISGKAAVTPVSGDYMLLWDATDSALKKVDASNFLDGGVTSVNGLTGAVTLVTGNISDTTSTQKYTTAANLTKLGYISVTQAVDLDTMESNIATNNAKVTNANHTGDVTGSAGLVIVPSAISGKTAVTPVSGDYLLLWDLTDSALKKVDASNFIGGAVSSVNSFTGAVTLVTGNISDTTSTQKYTTAADITKMSYISVTQAVDLDTMESNITTNNAKVTNANHTGDVTGADVLGIVPAAISGKTGVTPVAGDYVLLWDATDSALKKADVTTFITGGGDVTGPASSTHTGVAIFNGTDGKVLMNSLVTIDTSSVTIPGFLNVTGQARNPNQTALTTSGTVTWNIKNDPKSKIILAGNVTSLTISGIEQNSEATLYVKQHASSAYTISWPLTITWAGGVSPDISELDSFHIISLYSYNGTDLIGAHVGSTFISSGAVDSVNGFTGTITLVTGNISDTTSTQKYVTAADVTKLGYISVTQAVDLDTMESNITTNNAKVTNATHTGEVTGATSLTIDPTAISGKTGATPVAGDYVLLWDATDSTLKKADVTSFFDNATHTGEVTGSTSLTIDPTAISGKSTVTPVAGDFLLLWDLTDSTLKKVDANNFLGGAVSSVNGFTGAITLVTGNISDTTSAQKYVTANDVTKLGYISVTQAVDLDTMESNIATNNAKVTNANHTGDVTGSAGLVIVPAAISGKTSVTAVAGDYVLLWDATDSALKKADVTDFISAVTASSTTTFTNKRITKRVTTLTDAATIAINSDNMDMGKVTLTASRTLGTPTGTPTDGQTLLLEVVQGGSGSYTLTADSTSTAGSYRFGSDVTSFSLSTAVGKKDLILLTYLSDITGWAVASISKGYPA